jgi:predicted SnoaL-like aldol condensation-catalyzing enzyme
MKKKILMLTLLISAFTVAAQSKRNLAKEEKNKKIASDFFIVFYNDKNMEKAKKMMHPDFINHHPYSGKGIEATIAAVQEHLFGTFPDFKVSIKRIAAEGDLVWIQSYTQDFPGDHGKMSMDIWRLRNDLIAEHWDIIQDIPNDIAASSMY